MGCAGGLSLGLPRANRREDVLQGMIGQGTQFVIRAILDRMRHKDHRRIKAERPRLRCRSVDEFG